ncbi:MAG: hypothetical protein GWN61_12335, partial [candidate division Zixibacteria bacterium]|nr:hypothetical protein [candidate division KSB1 bacterium]NIT72094.1 hypothetical protein [candidate division KSB1 bacterium]NIV06933.1 hypothetical protein [candidate division Zixibacteria bacterium]NIW70258.1 hypothetical protein [candidate division KSB1 bacterium]NIX71774.1 hypothetical protein [candidate division KSB1 bacterium]
LRKIQLSENLSELVSAEHFIQGLQGEFPAKIDDILPSAHQDWQFLSVQVYDAEGQLRSERKHGNLNSKILNEHHFRQVEESAGQKMVFANRNENRFVA